MEAKKKATQMSSPNQCEINHTIARTKKARVLEYFIFQGSLNRFEAQHIGDHCLHTTVSNLANRHGLEFIRTPEKVPNKWGAPSEVTRYQLADDQREKAVLILWLLDSRTRRAAA